MHNLKHDYHLHIVHFKSVIPKPNADIETHLLMMKIQQAVEFMVCK